MAEILTWMGVFGVPSIFAICVASLKICKKYTKQIKILMKSQQAQMRTKLLELYHTYIDRGYITEEELEDWENQYQAYHELGQNGILDARREALMKLPTR